MPCLFKTKPTRSTLCIENTLRHFGSVACNFQSGVPSNADDEGDGCAGDPLAAAEGNGWTGGGDGASGEGRFAGVARLAAFWAACAALPN